MSNCDLNSLHHFIFKKQNKTKQQHGCQLLASTLFLISTSLSAQRMKPLGYSGSSSCLAINAGLSVCFYLTRFARQTPKLHQYILKTEFVIAILNRNKKTKHKKQGHNKMHSGKLFCKKMWPWLIKWNLRFSHNHSHWGLEAHSDFVLHWYKTLSNNSNN